MQFKKYDPDQCPPDYKLVFDHVRASTIGIPIIDNQDELVDYCSCCNQPINKYKLKMDAPIAALAQVGEIFPVYFKKIKYMLVISLIVLINVIPIIVLNIVQNRRQTKILERVSSFNNYENMQEQSIVTLTNIIMLIIYLQYIFYKQKIRENSLDKANITPSDYAIMISNFPKGNKRIITQMDSDAKQEIDSQYRDLKEEIIYTQIYELFENQKEQWEKYKVLQKMESDYFNHDFDLNLQCKIEKIYYTYQLKEYSQLLQIKKRSAAQKKQDFIKQSRKLKTIGSKKNQINAENVIKMIMNDYQKEQEAEARTIDQRIKDIQVNITNKQDFSNTLGVVIVVFNSQDVRKFVQQKFSIIGLKWLLIQIKLLFSSRKGQKKIIKKYLNNGKELLTVDRAPEPDDIIWEHLEISIYRTWMKRIFLYLVILIALALDITLLYLYQLMVFNSDYKSSTINTILVQLFGSFPNTLINLVFQSLVIYLVDQQDYFTKTLFEQRASGVLTMCMFINSSFNYYLFAFLYSYLFYEPSRQVLQDRLNLVTKINSVYMSNLFSNAIVTPLLNLFNVKYIILLFKRAFILRSYYKHRVLINQTNKSQKEQSPLVNSQSPLIKRNSPLLASNIHNNRSKSPLIINNPSNITNVNINTDTLRSKSVNSQAIVINSISSGLQNSQKPVSQSYRQITRKKSRRNRSILDSIIDTILITKESMYLMRQQEAHEIFTDPQFELKVKYAQIYNMIYLCMFFVPLNPVACVVQLLCFMLYYQVEKFLVLNVYSSPVQFSIRMTTKMCYLKYLPIFYALSAFFFNFVKTIHKIDTKLIESNQNIDRDLTEKYKLDSETYWLEVITILIATASLLLPKRMMFKLINRFVKKSTDETSNVLYEDGKKRFTTNYNLSNPVLKDLYIQKWITKRSNKMFEMSVSQRSKEILNKYGYRPDYSNYEVMYCDDIDEITMNRAAYLFSYFQKIGKLVPKQIRKLNKKQTEHLNIFSENQQQQISKSVQVDCIDEIKNSEQQEDDEDNQQQQDQQQANQEQQDNDNDNEQIQQVSVCDYQQENDEQMDNQVQVKQNTSGNQIKQQNDNDNDNDQEQIDLIREQKEKYGVLTIDDY